MNNSISLVKNAMNRLVLVLSALMLTVCGFAQSDTKNVDVNINAKTSDGSNFFNNPVVWVVGGAIFILLLVALLRSNNRNA